MSRTKTYRNIAAKIRFFGLEVSDWGALAAAAGLLFALSNAVLVNAALLGAAWWWMYKVKAKRPEGYTRSLLDRRRSPRLLRVDKEVFRLDAE